MPSSPSPPLADNVLDFVTFPEQSFVLPDGDDEYEYDNEDGESGGDDEPFERFNPAAIIHNMLASQAARETGGTRGVGWVEEPRAAMSSHDTFAVNLFNEIDRSGSGEVSKLEIIAAVRKLPLLGDVRHSHSIITATTTPPPQPPPRHHHHYPATTPPPLPCHPTTTALPLPTRHRHYDCASVNVCDSDYTVTVLLSMCVTVIIL